MLLYIIMDYYVQLKILKEHGINSKTKTIVIHPPFNIHLYCFLPIKTNKRFKYCSLYLNDCSLHWSSHNSNKLIKRFTIRNQNKIYLKAGKWKHDFYGYYLYQESYFLPGFQYFTIENKLLVMPKSLSTSSKVIPIFTHGIYEPLEQWHPGVCYKEKWKEMLEYIIFLRK